MSNVSPALNQAVVPGEGYGNGAWQLVNMEMGKAKLRDEASTAGQPRLRDV